MEPTEVADGESLYRRVSAATNGFTMVEGQPKFSANAFSDRAHLPSVDRSSMRSNPADMKEVPSDAVTKVETAEVRACCSIPIDGEAASKAAGDPTRLAALQKFAVDAIHRPIKASENVAANDAHCEIECSPHIEVRARFNKLKEALALLANRHGFVVPPSA